MRVQLLSSYPKLTYAMHEVQKGIHTNITWL